MAKNKFYERLMKLEGAVDLTSTESIHANVLRTPSPSFNSIFGNGHGLPLGFTCVLFGPPKGGKSVLVNAMIGQLHRDDPEAFAVKFNTEMRERAQSGPAAIRTWGIDPHRYIAYDVNDPVDVFDRIEHELVAAIQDGMKLKMIAIDSTNNIQGKRQVDHKSIAQNSIGDKAYTLQQGLERILPVIRKHNIGLVLTSHVRAEMDQTEIMRGNKNKMAAAFGLKHFAEYFIYVEPNQNASGKSDLFGKKLQDESVKDFVREKEGEQIAHKIKAFMRDSSLGPKRRTAEFTLDYRKGIVNTHEEVFILGVNRNIVGRPNLRTYTFGDQKWDSKEGFLRALEADTDLQKAIVNEFRRRDLDGGFAEEALDDDGAKMEARALLSQLIEEE